MRGVVLRCPTCGTTQVEPGECEACFEGTVRYFCGNHTPGLWLDAPACTVCGATLGKAAPKAPARLPVPGTVPLHRTRRPGASRTGTPARGEPVAGGSRRPPRREVEIEDAPAAPSLRDLLADLSIGRERPPFEVDELPPPAPERELPGPAPFLGGCLLRLLLLVLLLIVLAVAGVFVLLGGILR
jgi:hypothetical protein